MRGPKPGTRKLTPEQIHEALRRYDAGERVAEIACEYGVHRMTLYRAMREEAPSARPPRGKPVLSAETVEAARRRYEAGETFEEIANAYGVHRATIFRAVHGAYQPRRRKGQDWFWSMHRQAIRRHWVTAAQAAEILGIDRRSVCDLCRRGRLPGAFLMGDGPGAVWLIPKVVALRRAGKETDATNEPTQ